MNEKTIWERLKEPFKTTDIEWRLARCGKDKNNKIWGIALAYVTNRAIQNRLDEVLGPDNWQNDFKMISSGGALCGISVRITHSDKTTEWITKWDGSDNSDIEATKGGLSGAMKRSAVQLGIGRYLYYLEESFVTIAENGIYSGKTKDGIFFKWNPPVLPEWALPDIEKLPFLKETVKSYIDKGTLTGEGADKAKSYIDTNNKKGLQDVVFYIEKQLQKTA